MAAMMSATSHPSFFHFSKLSSIPRTRKTITSRFYITSSSLKRSIQRPCGIFNMTQKLEEPPRRSANYHPTIWDHEAIQSFQSPYSRNALHHRREELMLEVITMLLKAHNQQPPSVDQLQLVDSMERLGVAYLFEKEIEGILDGVHGQGFDMLESIYETALAFRLLRQHGYDVSSDVFHRFKDEKGGFKESLIHDVKGLLSLYEASYLAVKGEYVLEEAREFSVRHLKPMTGEVGMDLENQVRDSLHIPLHWRMQRLEARHYIDVYGREEGRSSVLLELAKIDFNFVQTIHQEELKELSKWWKGLDLGGKLKFSRDRLVENFLWVVGIVSEPEYSKCRMGITKLICILTVIDDLYDVYGSLEEVKNFTMTIKSWDSQALGSLPINFEICYSVLYNFIEEIANDILVDYGENVIPFYTREWEILCGAYLAEAEWFKKGYKPSLKEYLQNAWISVGGPIVMVHAFFLIGHILRDETNLKQGFTLIYWSSLITRLSDDLGTSKAEMERGDTPKSIQCHMNETHQQEEVSREYIRSLVDLAWKELNQERIRTHLPRNFVNMVLNMARTSQCIFQLGDGIGESISLTKAHIVSLFMKFVPL